MDDRIDLAQGTVAPEHPHLLDSQALVARNEKDLDVEPEPVNAAAPEDLPGDMAGKALETALRIPNPGNCQKPHDFLKFFPIRIR